MRRCRIRGAQGGSQGFCVSKVFPGTYFPTFRRGAARRSSWASYSGALAVASCFSKEDPSMIFLFLRIMPYNHAIFQRHDYALTGKMLAILKDYKGLSAASAPRTHLPSGDRPEAEEGAGRRPPQPARPGHRALPGLPSWREPETGELPPWASINIQ